MNRPPIRCVVCERLMYFRAVIRAQPGHALYECPSCGHATVAAIEGAG